MEMPSGVALLAIGAGVFCLNVLIWGAAGSLSFWPRLIVRLLATAALILAPLAFLAEIQLANEGGAPRGAAPGGEKSAEYKYELPADDRPAAKNGHGGPNGVPLDELARGGEASEPPPPAASAPAPPEPAAPRAGEPRDFTESAPAPEAAPEAAAPEAAPEAAAPEDAPAREILASVPISGESEAKWDIVPVFYGTDRKPDTTAERVSYGSERGYNLLFGQALVTVPKSHVIPNVERPWNFTVPYTSIVIGEAEDPEKHFTIEKIVSLSKAEFLRLAGERLAQAQRFKDRALVFVHGYNTSFDVAVYRTAQIAYDLGFDGVPFLYSWPSNGSFGDYRNDRENAEASERHMRDFLKVVCNETGAKQVSIIAHSLGNKPLLAVLKDLRNATPPSVTISEVILAAPDVDRDQFQNLIQDFNGLAKGVTLYAAANDRALQASQRAWSSWWNFWSGGVPRAGEVPPGGPVVVAGVESIDITLASTDLFSINHNGFATKTELIDDMRLLIETGAHPPDQRQSLKKGAYGMKPAKAASGGVYWQYVPRPSNP